MEFDFETALRNTPHCYEPCDAVKFCYQAAYGAEHMIGDNAAVYFNKEYESVTAGDGMLTEQLSEEYFRINLAVWKNKALPSEWLFNMFYLSATKAEKGDVKPFIEAAKKLATRGELPFDEKRLDEYLLGYDGGAVHHSEVCRKKKSPAYRVVHKRYVRMISLLEAFSKCQVMAIDGRAAAGKSTLASDMAEITRASVIHMDDFFLPPQLRTQERLSKPGGNIDYERFAKEVLPYLEQGKEFSYNKFDCAKMALGEKVRVKEARHYIVEGSYSHHPYFNNYADLLVFCDVSPYLQLFRIENRNGRQMIKEFAEKWIPMEERYFKAFSIKEKADIRVCSLRDYSILA